MARFNVSNAVKEAQTAADDTKAPQDGAEAAQAESAAKGEARTKPAGKGSGGTASGATAKKSGRTTKGTEHAQQRGEDLGKPLSGENKPQPPSKNGKRVAVPMPKDMRDALALARVDDDIEATVRIRAMVELWMHDERLRTRVDKLARTRSAELISHRWPTGTGE